MKKKKIKIIIEAILILLTISIESNEVFNYCLDSNFFLNGLANKLFPNQFIYIFISGFIFAAIYWINKQSISVPKYVKIFSVIFAIVMYTGRCCYELNAVIHSLRNIYIIVLSIIYLFGMYFLFINSYLILHILNTNLINKEIKLNFWDKHYKLITFILIILFWSPYIIFRLPAGQEWDAYYQILEFYGYWPLNNHWPILSTLFFGSLVKLGEILFNSISAGLVLIVIVQTLFSAFVFSYAISFLKRLKVKDVYLFLILGYILISPLFPGYLTSVVKDAMFSIMVLLLMILIGELIIFNNKTIKYYIFTFIVASLVCLFRNNGIFIVGGLLIAVLIYKLNKKDKLKIVLSLLASFILCLGVTKILYPSLGWSTDGDEIRESFSIPFQQTARYLTLYPDDVSEEELASINKVLDAEKIAKNYYSLCSDNVKDTYHAESLGDLLDYLKTWFCMFWRHPGCYIDATLCNIYGFFWPQARMADYNNCGFYMSAINMGEMIYDRDVFYGKFLTDVNLNIYYTETRYITMPLCSVGVTLLATIFVFIKSLVKKNSKTIIMALPSIISILVCVASPTFYKNGFRYALPIICLLPFLIGLSTRLYDKDV